MNRHEISAILEEANKSIAWIEKVKRSVRLWGPEDKNEITGRRDASIYLGVSYKSVGILTSQGILKSYGEGRSKLYFKRDLQQALRDHAVWQPLAPKHKKPRALKAQGNCSTPQQGDKKIN
jgi:hypothetical protein